jgi:hypothetical protein
MERGIFFAMPNDGAWIDSALEARYEATFEAMWMSHWKAVSAVQIGDADKRELDRYREICFKSAFRASGNSEVAGLVSDDMELLFRSNLAGRCDEWLVRLETAYFEGRFPMGDREAN